MRIGTKKNPSKTSSFWHTCGELWHAVLDDQRVDPILDRLKITSADLGIRQRAVHQMTSMAKLFGISPHRLQQPKSRAHRLLNNCDTCTIGSRCFVTKQGRPDGHAHVSPKACPNFKEFQDLARDIGSRTAIKNKLI